MIARLIGWLMSKLGITLGDDMDVSPLCETCGHRYDSHQPRTYEGSALHPCFEPGCRCMNYVPK